jgi:nitroreductase
MNILEAIKTRASIRAFLDQPIEKEIVEKIIEAARWAPSGTNTQPWQVVALTGDKKQQLCQQMLAAYQADVPANPDYHYYPEKWREPYKARRYQCGLALYSALGIAREDKAARKKVWELNYRAFNAPVMLLLFIDADLEKGSWLDYGMFFQNIMLAALAFGLGTCPQAALAEYPDIARNNLPEKYHDKTLIAGVALGYPDNTSAINGYRTEREAVQQFCEFLGE